MDKEELRLKLEEEVALGQRATRAYDIYIRNFLETNYKELYADFVNCTEDEVLALKKLVTANMELELTIHRDMNTGKLAAKQLESYDAVPRTN